MVGWVLIRDLARTRPAHVLDKQFPENHLFGQAKISIKKFTFLDLGGGGGGGGKNQIFS